MVKFARLVALGLLVLAAEAPAQGYPAKAIRLVVPFPAGGPADIGARIMAQKLNAEGLQLVVDNRPGANTVIGAELVAKAPADGYTLLWAIDSTLVMNQSLYAKLSYDPIKDFAPIARTMAGQPLMLVNAASGPKSVQELIGYARANPGKVNFASGTMTNQLAGEQIKSLAGVDMVYVPYKGSAGAVQGLLAGDVTMILDGVSANLTHIRSGKFRALATLAARPVAALPDVPTFALAAGLPGFSVEIWHGVVAPAGTSADIVGKLNQHIVRAFEQPEVKEKLASLGQEPATCTPAEFAAFIRSESERWAKVIRQAGFRIE
jgi:tripartite-type tricarboxylate transporter receptor subunit TctC